MRGRLVHGGCFNHIEIALSEPEQGLQNHFGQTESDSSIFTEIKKIKLAELLVSQTARILFLVKRFL